ncbi:hypothetical protein J3F83DRAFT_391639 [Trichoderma novae-zelandiae]
MSSFFLNLLVAAREAAKQGRCTLARNLNVPYSAKGGGGCLWRSSTSNKRCPCTKAAGEKRRLLVLVLCCLVCASEYGVSCVAVCRAAQCWFELHSTYTRTYLSIPSVLVLSRGSFSHLVVVPYRALFSPVPFGSSISSIYPRPQTLFSCWCATNKQTPDPFFFLTIQSWPRAFSSSVSHVYRETNTPVIRKPHFILAYSACALVFVLATCHHTSGANILRRFWSFAASHSLPPQVSPFGFPQIPYSFL